MFEIYILSKNKKIVSGLKQIVSSYMYDKMVTIEIKVFKDIKLLLKTDISDAILFIDDSDERSALKTAQILREHDHFEEIVLITDDIESAYEAFKVDAYRVLRSPVANQDVYEAVDSFRKKKLSSRVILIKNGPDRLTLPMNEIIYVASINRETLIVTKNGTIPATIPLFQISAQLSEEFFFACHRSYVINMSNIRSVSKTIDKLYMTNGDEIPISRRRKAEFMSAREQFIDTQIGRAHV